MCNITYSHPCCQAPSQRWTRAFCKRWTEWIPLAAIARPQLQATPRLPIEFSTDLAWIIA